MVLLAIFRSRCNNILSLHPGGNFDTLKCQTTRTRKKGRKIKGKERERERGGGSKEERIELFREARSELSGDPGKSTDSFNHGNRISKAESRKNRERQRLIHTEQKKEETHQE